MLTSRSVPSAETAPYAFHNGEIFARQAILPLLTLLLLAICLPASADRHLAKLSIPVAVIFGVGSTTGIVSLDAISSKPITVVMKSSNANVKVPATVLIKARTLTASFTISTLTTVLEPTYATISGAVGDWLQSSMVACVSAAYKVSIKNLSTRAGNSCILLAWHDLEDDSYRGFNIYKISGSAAVKLNAMPYLYAMYADTGLTNGKTYRYAVTVIDAAGRESAHSAVVGATPSATKEKLSWIDPPRSGTGRLKLYASTPSRSSGECTLLVDGARLAVGWSDDPRRQDGNKGVYATEYNTAGLSDGTHTFQIVGDGGGDFCTTPPLSIRITNDFKNFKVENLFMQYEGDVCAIRAAFPSGTIHWTVEVLSESNVVLRTWEGTTASMQLSWDGTNAAGVVQEAGNYTVRLTALDGEGLSKQISKETDLIRF